jgi:putative membrane protein
MNSKRLTRLTALVCALGIPWLASAQQAQPPAGPPQPPWGWPGPWHMWRGAWDFWWIFPLLMLFMILICAAVFFLWHRSGCGMRHHWGPWHMMDRSFGPGRSGGDPTYSALQILNERFAKGEIEKQEYEERRAAILASWQR